MPSLPTCPSPLSRATSYLPQSVPRRYLQTRLHRNSSIPVETPHSSAARFVNVHRNNQHKPRAETWIHPNSLTETLAEHRHANRSGKATDGVPIKKDRTVQQTHKRKDGVENEGVINITSHASFKRLYGSDRQLHADKIFQHTADWRISHPPSPGLRLPWIRELSKTPDIVYNSSGLQRLSDEIHAGNSYLSPTVLERQAADKALVDIREMVHQALAREDMKIQLIGSRATGLDGPISDIDINLRSPFIPEDHGAHALAVLEKLYAKMRFSRTSNNYRSQFITTRFIRKSAVPLIDCIHIPSGLGFQIQQTMSGYVSLELSKAFMAEYPTLCSLYRVIKQMLLIRGLTGASQRGLTSYPLLNMIVTSLKLGKSPKDMAGLGAQLLEFLELFSNIDFESTAIRYVSTGNPVDDLGFNLVPPDSEIGDSSIDPIHASPVLRKIKRRPDTSNAAHLMSLQDPANCMNDLGRSAYTIRQAQAIFIQAHYRISESLRKWNAKLSSGLDMRQHGFPLLAWCLEADYSSFEESRRSLRKYALE